MQSTIYTIGQKRTSKNDSKRYSLIALKIGAIEGKLILICLYLVVGVNTT